MDFIVQYFETIPSLHRTLMMVGGIAFFWLLESAYPVYCIRYDKWHHAALNIFFTTTTIAVNFSMAFVLVSAAEWTKQHQFGLLNWLPKLPISLVVLVGLLGLDLVGAYLPHWLEHQMKWMWRFHLVHHTDNHVDTTTANRHHPGESVIRFSFTTLAVLVAGSPMWLVMLYQALSVGLSQFNHANIGLPLKLDRIVRWIIVTPDMHHLHHHFQQPHTDSNYGNIFAIWDRAFGTHRHAQRDEIVYGIDSYPDPSENSNVFSLLMIPFNKYRNPPGGKFAASDESSE